MENEKIAPIPFRQFVLAECERRWPEKNHSSWSAAPYEWKQRYYTDMYASLWRKRDALSTASKRVIMPTEYEINAWEDMFPPACERAPSALVKSLNALYDRNAIHYWCNATADINLPGDDVFAHRGVEDLPADIRSLYESYQTENLAVNVYVVSIESRKGMALVFLLDHEMETEMSGLNGDEGADLLRNEAPNIAGWIAEHAPDGVEIFFGEDTDPCGHEILIFVPSELCEQLLGGLCKKADPLVGKAWDHIYKVFHMC